MSELLDKIKEVQSQVNNCSTLEAKQLLEQADGDVDLAVALFKEAHVAPPVTPAYGQPASQNMSQPKPQPEEPRRRRRLWWIPLVAVGGYLAIIGLGVLIAYQVTDGFSSGTLNNKSSSKLTYNKPTKYEIIDALSYEIKYCGKFNTLDSDHTYVNVPIEDFDSADFPFSTSTGSWSITMKNATVCPKSVGYNVTGTLKASGFVTYSGTVYVSSFSVANYVIK